MQTPDTSIELYWNDGMLRSRHGAGTPPSTHIPVVDDFAEARGEDARRARGAVDFEVINRTASAHFIGGMPIAETTESGVVDPYQRVFGHAGLHVMDGSVMPANPGVNPSLMITALAERAMSFWPNKGDADRGRRSALATSGWRDDAAPPDVPAEAPGELRFDAKPTNDPAYPY